MNPAVRLPALFVFIIALLVGNAVSQTAAYNPADKAKILSYIHTNWDTLSRSMTSCKSVVDPKVTTTPILYLPAGKTTPSSVTLVRSLRLIT